MFKVLVLLLLSTLFLSAIEQYEPLSKQYLHEGNHYLVSRTFLKEGVRYYLCTNTQTLHSDIITLDASKLRDLDKTFEQSPLARALLHATFLHVKGGTPHATAFHPKAIYLTMDMCPSRKRDYESEFIAQLTTFQDKVPIAIAVSSEWILHHQEAFNALKKNPKLDITWVNHTHTHFYDRMLEDRKNFMLHAKTNVKEEILELEKLLIEKGETPSIFFRFPGLMANETLMKELRETYFLIPLSADAWIAKNEAVKEGSFILIHGNKNEPQGIEMLEKMLPELMKKYHFSPIQEAFRP